MDAEVETEVTYRVADPAAVEDRLAALDEIARVRQTDHYLSPPGQDLAGDTSRYLRVREEDGGGSLDLHLVRDAAETEEYETAVEDPDQLLGILDHLGFTVTVVVRKDRTVYDAGDVDVVLDRIDGLGTFVELEADGPVDDDRLEELAADLGLDAAEKVVGRGYPDLLRERD